jgi:hypothetical protein
MIHTESKFYDGVEVRAQKPFDVRTIQERREDLYDINMWPHDTYIDENGEEHYTIYMKEGMTVTVTGTKENPVFEQYMLIDLSKMLNKDYSGWKLLGTGGTPGGGGSLTGNIDGGRADETYNQSQIIDGGSENGATVRGETEKE